MTEGHLRRIHWLTGIAAVILFVLTGAFMLWVHQPPVEQLDDVSRAVYRSRHIFILLVGVANLSRAAGLAASNVRVSRAAVVASAILCVAPVLLTAAFFVEPPLGVNGRAVSTPVLYSLFAAALIMAFQGRR